MQPGSPRELPEEEAPGVRPGGQAEKAWGGPGYYRPESQSKCGASWSGGLPTHPHAIPQLPGPGRADPPPTQGPQQSCTAVAASQAWQSPQHEMLCIFSKNHGGRRTGEPEESQEVPGLASRSG